MKYMYMKLFKLILIIFFTVTVILNCIGATYTGEIVPLTTSTYNSGSAEDNNGVIIHVARPGEIVFPEKKDLEGNIIQKGTPIIVLDQYYWERKVEYAKNNLLGAKSVLDASIADYKRAKKLVNKHAISVQDFQEKEAAYLNDVGHYENSKNLLVLAEQVLKGTIWIAPFEGIVRKVYLTLGMAAGQPPTIKIEQLNPIGIKLKMSRKDAQNINSTKSVTVFSPLNNKPFGIFHNFSQLTDDGIILSINNTPVYKSYVEVDGEKIPFVSDFGLVLNFYIKRSEAKLSLPSKAILKDSKGYYVWKAEGLKNMQPGKGLQKKFKIRRVNVEPDNITRLMSGCIKYRALKDSGNLEKYDMVILYPHKGFEDGKYFYTAKQRHVFMPGDKVKVVIEN
jgi:hypothetical protein